ncbi:MAG: ABC transporter permease [Deltaproteobacteria bacterium]|nr:ABC transporter permease [Deltaproteobacteria bacterium]
MTRLLAILTALALVALLFFGLLADAGPDTVFQAQTAAGLFVVILVIVLVATLMTSLYLVVFGRLADGFARRRFARFIGWKFLRSQRESETLRSKLARSVHLARARAVPTKLVLAGVGAALLIAAWLMTRPALWNSIADRVSPPFATTLHLILLVLGAAFLFVASLGLLIPTRSLPPTPRLRKRSAVTLPTFISIVGVAIGLWALIVVLGVIQGLQSDLRDKILRTNAHIVIEPARPDGTLGDNDSLEVAMRKLPRVTEADAYVRGEVMMSSPTGIAVNVVVKGMVPAALAASDQLRGRIVDGSIAALDRPELLVSDGARYPYEDPRKRKKSLPAEAAPDEADPAYAVPADLYPGLVIGIELASQLGLAVGDEIQLIAPDGDVGPTGLRPKLQSFRVAAIFQTGMYEYDQKLSYMALYAAQRFFDLGRDRNQLEARIDDPQAIDELAPALATILRDFPGLSASTLRERNKNLFSALALERIVMLIILGFIVFVASLLIVSSLVMFVVEKVREIAVLKALGASDGAIMSSFVHIGTFIGLFGVLAGIPLGVLTCQYLIAAGFTLPRMFYLSELPVRIDPFEITVFGLSAMGMCLLATLYPSKKASQLRPADGLRHG